MTMTLNNLPKGWGFFGCYLHFFMEQDNKNLQRKIIWGKWNISPLCPIKKEHLALIVCFLVLQLYLGFVHKFFFYFNEQLLSQKKKKGPYNVPFHVLLAPNIIFPSKRNLLNITKTKCVSHVYFIISMKMQ